ncbi:Txe/YoeB family addiction module toxin [Cognatishimia sp. 1_MG-2023]|uniref:Txe/YoeB family addiction module toxin n=1 Tax=Cognatishimia sp. 1_MG-2023 TaxID=3062642 RepID=UPI0026E1399B|nr:Txe/YoeB family addiction module toxin [Cognatishimia sp. 1_MG-2023]MDO6726622.1 Txe/YoeB family addiction module toxin [Cognatishimia sp. 1_MG-2023]
MRVLFSPQGWEDFGYWRQTDAKIEKKIRKLIEECRRHPFDGTGKPEGLKGDLTGFWSRRITSEHRLVYRVTGKGTGQTLEIAQARYHY